MPTYHVYYKVGGKPFQPDAGLHPRNVTHGKNFVFVTAMKAKSPDEVFKMMQGENIPINDQKVMVMAMRAQDVTPNYAHASMSVGDVLFDVTNKKWMQCDMVGWKILKVR